MRVLLDSHSTVTQNPSGGLQVRILEHKRGLIDKGITCKLYNKWEDKIEDYDIYHIIKVTMDSYEKVLFAKQKNKKVIISAVVPINGNMKIKLSLFLAKAMKLPLPHEFIRKSLLFADIITTESDLEKKFIEKYYGISGDKIITIPNGVNERFYNNKNLDVSFSEIYNLKEPFILQVGRIDRNKNQLNVIRALKDTGLPVVFIGGPFLNEIEYFNKCKEELSDNMIMTGWIRNDSDLLLSAYREAKLLLLPSHHETFGNVIIEAGVAGNNIACSSTLPINEYKISRHWGKFNPHDKESIREVVLKEYSKPKDKIITNEFILTFSWTSVIKQYIEIYNSLL